MNRVFIHLRVLLHCGWCLNISSFSSTSLVILFHSVDPFHSPDSIFPGTPFNRDINIPICFILWGLSSSSRRLFHSFPSRSASSFRVFHPVLGACFIPWGLSSSTRCLFHSFSSPGSASFFGAFHSVLSACFIPCFIRSQPGLLHSLGSFIQYSASISFFPIPF